MNRFLLITGGLCGAIAIFFIMRPEHTRLQDMAHDLGEAWSDRHTVV